MSSFFPTGIWLSTSAIVQKSDDGSEYLTFLLDCEGAGDPLEGNDESNARIALSCILISSVLMFNNTGRPDRSSLQFLSYLETIRKRIPQEVSTPQINFPAFLWVFRDFFLQLPMKKKTKKPYTLKEYMVERILSKPKPPQSQSSRRKISNQQTEEEEHIVDCLLGDFRSFDVASIGLPKKRSGFSDAKENLEEEEDDEIDEEDGWDESFTPEELSRLDEFDWNMLDSAFRNDVENVISLCLSKTTPFELGTSSGSSFAKGSQFAKWCDHVIELVNSEKVLPNIPDMQEQLLQSIADQLFEEAFAEYSQQMLEHLNSCPTFNKTDKDDEIVSTYMNSKENLEGGIAEDNELLSKSQELITLLSEGLEKEVGNSQKIFMETQKKLQQKCSDFLTNYLSRDLNLERSRDSCQFYAKRLLEDFRTLIRTAEESRGFTGKVTNIEEFEAEAAKLQEQFQNVCRGPAVRELLQSYIVEQLESDRIYFKKVFHMAFLYNQLEIQKSELEEDNERKNKEIESQKEQQALLRKEMIEERIKQEKIRHEEKEKHSTEIKQLEDKARIESQKSQEMHEIELQRLKNMADEDKKKEIQKGEQKLQDETQKLQKQMNRAISEEQQKLVTVKTTMEDELRGLEQEKKLQQKLQQQEKEELERKIEELENRCSFCNIM